MTYVMVMHKVEDFEKWKSIYDEHGAMRKKLGSKGAFAFRNSEDPNEMIIISQWDDMESAKNFAESDSLKNAMQNAGVKGKPDVYFLDEIERTPY
jgi:heme-degrading monooxygenase HmoA